MNLVTAHSLRPEPSLRHHILQGFALCMAAGSNGPAPTSIERQRLSCPAALLRLTRSNHAAKPGEVPMGLNDQWMQRDLKVLWHPVPR